MNFLTKYGPKILVCCIMILCLAGGGWQITIYKEKKENMENAEATIDIAKSSCPSRDEEVCTWLCAFFF